VKRHPYYEQHEESDDRLSARAGFLFKCEALGYVLNPAESSWMLSTGSDHVSQAGPVGPRHVGAPDRLIIWRSFKPIFFTLSQFRTGLANMTEGACPNCA